MAKRQWGGRALHVVETQPTPAPEPHVTREWRTTMGLIYVRDTGERVHIRDAGVIVTDLTEEQIASALKLGAIEECNG